MKPAALIVGITVGLLAFAVYNSRNNNDQLVGDYCSYGSRSLAQLAGCLGSVTPGEVVYSDMPAADFANGKRAIVGSGSGPFCAEAAAAQEARQVLGEMEREQAQEGGSLATHSVSRRGSVHAESAFACALSRSA